MNEFNLCVIISIQHIATEWMSLFVVVHCHLIVPLRRVYAIAERTPSCFVPSSLHCKLVFLFFLRWFLFDYVSASQFLDSPKIFDYFWRRNGDAAAWAWSWIRKIWTIWSKHYKLLLILNTDETMTWNCKKCLKHFLVSTNLVSIRSLLSNTNIVESFQHFRILNLNYSEKKNSAQKMCLL